MKWELSTTVGWIKDSNVNNYDNHLKSAVGVTTEYLLAQYIFEALLEWIQWVWFKGNNLNLFNVFYPEYYN